MLRGDNGKTPILIMHKKENEEAILFILGSHSLLPFLLLKKALFLSDPLNGAFPYKFWQPFDCESVLRDRVGPIDRK